VLLSWLLLGTVAEADESMDPLNSSARFASLALECIHREYPNKIAHVLQSDEDVRPPRELTPVFSGCFDWHSAVHGHWLLVRLLRLQPDAEFAAPTREALALSFVPEKVAAESAYLAGSGRASFERPYGLAWLLQLCAELRGFAREDAQAATWSEMLRPLERETVQRFADWLPKLLYPIRTGEHSQTAFALCLVWDWARVAGDEEMQELVKAKALEFHAEDRACNLSYEPGGQDFLSPCIAEADLMRRILPSREFARWLLEFLPEIPEDGGAAWLPVARVSDRSDGKLAHLDGLNISRAWMLEGILSALPVDDPRRSALEAAASAHRLAGLASVTGEHYEGGHWLGSFATYLVTRAGME
jgi:hypothetical protein